MKVESRVPDIAREQRVRDNASTAANRRRSVTSDPGVDAFKVFNLRQPVSSQDVEAQRYSNASLDISDINKAVERLNEYIHDQQRDVSFSVDEEADVTVIKVIKTETGELVKQIPPDIILAMKARLRKTTGLFVDKRI